MKIYWKIVLISALLFVLNAVRTVVFYDFPYPSIGKPFFILLSLAVIGAIVEVIQLKPNKQ